MSPTDRQRVERVPGSRRVKLTPAPGTDAEPVVGDEDPDAGGAADAGASGSNDERLKRDVPPHY
ncbi:hypothetical protein [Microbacterium gallinarum]|jgi:hypothetical protein|uniref:Uncharacterized protein n=1 Tax=Microbacterium gallinarum TaxID=2762209 RepID=A0ABR8X7G5_9MICO|nr:hypothetical protein [Microbacterium gallinarum]MBD8024851.1 hypothetical protein [Microbacterium gallinarum]